MTRGEAVDHLWGKISPDFYLTKEEFTENLKDWQIDVVVGADDIPSFIVVRKGPDFHFHSLHTGATLTMGAIKRFLRAIITAHGYAATKTPKEDTKQRRFNERFGFEKVGEDEYDVHYRIERLPREPLH
jgi:hypothetical protein